MRRPIGLFDSGIGGLTVLREIHRQLPQEDLVYFGDTAHVPYGTKSKETITRFSIDNMQFLQSFDVKVVVVACNTASALSLEVLKEKLSVPVIGVIEPGARQAALKTKNGRVGVIGTKATIASGSYESCLRRINPRLEIFSQACPLFVPLAEEGWLDGDIVLRIARVYLEPMKNFGIDTLILGCTHYPLLVSVIRQVIGPGVALVNSADETAQEAKRLLESMEIQAELGSSQEPRMQFYVSDEPESFRILGERFLGEPIAQVAKVADYVRS